MQDPGQPALVDHRHAIGQREQLVEVLRDDQNRGTLCREVEQRLMDRRGGAGIDAPGRLRDDQDAGRLQDLPADDEFLQIAAREARRAGIDAAGDDVKGLDDAAREAGGRRDR